MAKFVMSATHPNHYPSHSLPEFSFVGPSNSGKSTLINALAREKIAHTSKKTGKTRTLNFYDFNIYYIVDMPGYGYAEVSNNLRSSLISILDNYFSSRETITGVCQLCSTHGLSEKDLEVVEYLSKRFHNYLLLVNKVDKISKIQQSELKSSIIKATNLDETKVILISAKTMHNIVLLKQTLEFWSK